MDIWVLGTNPIFLSPVSEVISTFDHWLSWPNNCTYVPFYQNNKRGASAHYTVDEGAIINNVRDEHSAQHVGDCVFLKALS